MDKTSDRQEISDDILSIPFDQYQRYKIVSDIINQYRNGKEKLKILEVGASTAENIIKFLPYDEVYFLDIEYPPEYKDKKNYIIGDITQIDLQEEYDFVISIDTYEHIPLSLRKKYIDRVLSFSEKATIIAAPFNTMGVSECEVFSNETYKQSHENEYKWLQEHIKFGLPSLSITLEMIKESGGEYKIFSNGYLPRWFENINLYLLTEGHSEFSKMLTNFWKYYNENFYKYDNKQPAYRQVIVINKNGRMPNFSNIDAEKQDQKDFTYKYELMQKLISRIKESYQLYQLSNFKALNETLNKFRENLKKTEENLSILETELNETKLEKNKTIEKLNILETELNETKLEKNKTIEKLNILETELNETKLEKNKTIDNLSILEKELNEIKRSISWQLTSEYQNIFVDRFLPHNTRRRAFYDMNLRGCRIFISEGFGGFWKSFKARIKKHLPFIILKYIDYILYKIHILKSTTMAKKNTIVHENTDIDIIIPVYNNAQYLRECINSAINQSYQNTHVTILDDKSTDPTVYNILAEFKNNHRVSVSYHDRNKGISATTNDAIIYSSGKYVAFLDCDDILLPEAMEKVASFIVDNPKIEFIYTDRININSDGDVIEHISFKNRSTDAKNELLMGMYTSHLKVIKRDCFLKVGLFSSRYDSAQDYDIALRMSEHVQFGYINEFLYKHRVHDRQTTVVAQMQQKSLAEQIKQESLNRRALYDGTINKLTSIVMLTLNRVEDTKRSINALYANTSLPFELIILDNGSTDPHIKKYLEELVESKSNITIHFEEKNLGCSGGRRKATSYAKGDYIVTLDNDICVTRHWLENFILRIEADEKIAAACAKVVFPNGKVQYNGGSMEIEGCFARFSLIDSDKDQLDFSTLIERDCDWIPGGAMIIKRKYREMVSHRVEMQGSYEDNDYALQLKKIGVNLVNCPLTEVIHHHLGFGINTMKDQKYLSERYNKERLMNSLLAFYKFNNLIIKDEALFKMLGLANKTDDEIINLVKKLVDACIDENLSENKPLCSSEELFYPEIVSH